MIAYVILRLTVLRILTQIRLASVLRWVEGAAYDGTWPLFAGQVESRGRYGADDDGDGGQM
jgi:hypothetical protein